MTKIVPLTDIVEIQDVCLLATMVDIPLDALVIAQNDTTERWFVIESLVDQIPMRKNWLLFSLKEAPRPQTEKVLPHIPSN